MRKALDILQSCGELKKDLALNIGRTGGLDRNSVEIFEATVNDADGAVIYFHLLQHRLRRRNRSHIRISVANGQAQARSPGPPDPVRASVRRM